MDDLYKRIEKLCEDKGVSVTEMCRVSGASRGSLTDLKKGRISGLNIDTLSKIAAYFNVSIDYLNGGEEKPVTNGDELSQEEADFIKWFRTQASEKDKALVRMIVEGDK